MAVSRRWARHCGMFRRHGAAVLVPHKTDHGIALADVIVKLFDQRGTTGRPIAVAVSLGLLAREVCRGGRRVAVSVASQGD